MREGGGGVVDPCAAAILVATDNQLFVCASSLSGNYVVVMLVENGCSFVARSTRERCVELALFIEGISHAANTAIVAADGTSGKDTVDSDRVGR